MKCLAFDMVLWEVNQGTGTHRSALCNTYHDSHSIPEVGVCMFSPWPRLAREGKNLLRISNHHNRVWEQKKYRCAYFDAFFWQMH